MALVVIPEAASFPSAPTLAKFPMGPLTNDIDYQYIT
jgi:hypothetical protein